MQTLSLLLDVAIVEVWPAQNLHASADRLQS